MLEGLLVDLVPMGRRLAELEHTWENSEAAFWGDMGDRQFFSRATVERHQAERAESRARERSLGVPFGIQTKDGTPIGVFYLGLTLPYHRIAMLGIQIGEPDYWGGGYGTEALLLAVDYAFGWLDLRRVWLMTMSLNARMMRSAEKAGFRLEARQREATVADGVRHDALIYGLLREEWPGRAALIKKLGLRARNED